MCHWKKWFVHRLVLNKKLFVHHLYLFDAPFHRKICKIVSSPHMQRKKLVIFERLIDVPRTQTGLWEFSNDYNLNFTISHKWIHEEIPLYDRNLDLSDLIFVFRHQIMCKRIHIYKFYLYLMHYRKTERSLRSCFLQASIYIAKHNKHYKSSISNKYENKIWNIWKYYQFKKSTTRQLQQTTLIHEKASIQPISAL